MEPSKAFDSVTQEIKPSKFNANQLGCDAALQTENCLTEPLSRGMVDGYHFVSVTRKRERKRRLLTYLKLHYTNIKNKQ